MPMPRSSGSRCEGTLRPVARNTCGKEVVQMISPTVGAGNRVFYLPCGPAVRLAVILQAKFLVADVAFAFGPTVNSP